MEIRDIDARDMDIRDMIVSVARGFYVAGKTEEGHDYEAELYSILLTDSSGRQWGHFKSWLTAEPVEYYDEECGIMYGFTDTRESSFREAQALATKIERQGVICLDHWKELAPRYGSAAYSDPDDYNYACAA